jgi:predicted N-acetyltransferase YhbS
MALSPVLRAERADDRAAVFAMNAAAFETAVEADLVEALRTQAEPAITLVAELEPGALAGAAGVVSYHEACDAL